MLKKQHKNHIFVAVVATSMLATPVLAASASSGDVNILASAGLGSNSNVYHAPSTTYIDLAKRAAPTIVPNVQGGLFVPMKLGVDYMLTDDMKLKYKFSGRFHMDNALSSADTFDQNLKLSKALDFNSGFELKVGGFVGKHERLYVDRDTGTEKLSNAGVNVSNRYTYQDVGIEGELSKEIGGIKYIATGKYAVLNYDDPIVISSLDHTMMHFAGFAQFKFMNDHAKVKVGYEYMTRTYVNRRSRDLTAKLSTNPFLKYTYGTFSGKFSYKVNKNTRVFIDAEQITRTDEFVGYNSYAKSKLKLRVLHKLSDDLSVRGKLAVSNTNYDKAFAFENPAAAKKTSNTTTASLKAKYQWDGLGDPELWVDTTYQNVDTTDLRYKYTYTELALGGDWKF